jgi:hypothetical protein
MVTPSDGTGGDVAPRAIPNVSTFHSSAVHNITTQLWSNLVPVVPHALRCRT